MIEIYDKEFCNLIKKYTDSEEFKILSQHKHHIKTSIYDHTLRVAYLCYQHNKKSKHCKVSQEELIRAAILHDFFFYDRYDKENREFGRVFHLFHHPNIALQNAMCVYPDLTKNEIDAIKRHMFPVTIVPPKTRCGWIICWYDKIAAVEDYLDGSFVGSLLTKNIS